MEIIIILSLIVLNGIFSMSEIALVSARRSKLETEARHGSKAARAALRLAGEPDRFLSTIQIGITLVGILTGLYSGKAFAGDLAAVIARWGFLTPYAHVIATISIVIVVTYLTIVLGELVPKRLGLNMAEMVAKTVARPMALLSRIMTPMVWLLSGSTRVVLGIFGIKDNENKVTEEEIKSLVKEGLHAGEVQEVEHDIVGRVFSLGDRDINSVMTHRGDFVKIVTGDTKETIRDKVMRDMHDVYPVTPASGGDILGVVYLRDLFGRIDAADFSLGELMRPPHYLPDNKSVYSALELFRRDNVKYGFVTDEFGDVKGIVTITDIMEALVGEMAGEGRDKDITARADGSFLVDGQCPFYDFLEFFDMEDMYAVHDYNTLSGLILEILEHVPHESEKFSWNRFDFEIMDMDGARIDKVLVVCRDMD